MVKNTNIELLRLHKIVSSINDGLRVIDMNFNVTFSNKAMDEKFGNFKNKKCYELWGEIEPCKECVAAIARRQQCTETREVEKDGAYYQVQYFPIIRPDGTCKEAIEIIRNITEEKRLKAELNRKESLAVLGEFGASLAHELRNPMGAIMTGIKLLSQEGKVSKNMQTVLEILKKETSRLNLIVSEFLNYARPHDPVLHPMDINVILRDVIKLIRQDENLMADHTIETAFANNTPPIAVDIEHVRQVFLNIMTNALQAMETKGTLWVRSKKEGAWLLVEIADTGKGIAPEFLDKIFIPFFTKKRGGTGLGLAIAQKHVEEHKGNIAVESTMGQGTTFRIKLPVCKITNK